ncbi:MAG: U6 snRNA-associated Sm-like protein LSm6 [Promethearchaeota archaeon]
MSIRNPLRVLSSAVNSIILIRLKDGTEYRGRLKKCDTYMNLIVENAMELEEGEPVSRYGEIFIRGNNILFIKPEADED